MPRRGRLVTGGSGVPDRFWTALIARLLHPLQVQIIEAMWWIGQPLSASQLVQVFCKEQRLSAVSYHVQRLADIGALRPSGQRRPTRGSIEKFYRLGLLEE
jgi:hypothetical protein